MTYDNPWNVEGNPDRKNNFQNPGIDLKPKPANNSANDSAKKL
jgi:hypothetical protein